MADIAGLALGIVGVITPLTKASLFLCDLYQSSSQFGSEANALRYVCSSSPDIRDSIGSIDLCLPSLAYPSVRMSVASRQIKTFEEVLLAEKRFNWLSGSLFRELETTLQQDLYDLLQELKRCLFLFVEMGKTYGIDSQRQAPPAKTVPGIDVQVIDSHERGMDLQVNATWARKIIWSARDKKSLNELVKEIEHWTGLLRLTIQDTLSTFPGFQQPERLDALGDFDKQAVDLQLALSIRRILLGKPSAASNPAPELALRDFETLPAQDGITLGTMKAPMAHTNVLIEKKRFAATNPAEDEKRLGRAKQLATLLRKATDPAFRVLRALGYTYEPLEPCATIVYEIPGHLLRHPLTLQQLFSLKLLEARPPLEYRFRLALMVTESLFFLHSLGWVHKSFRSSNIVLFPMKSQCSIPWQEAERCSIERILDCSDLRLVGFDLARPEAEQSSLTDLSSSFDNLYRPPTRWGSPTESWSAGHDLYSLGAVLLELGLWQRLDALDHRASLNDPWQVQKLLLLHATQRLPYTMGSKYAAIVTSLLKRKLEESVRGRHASFQATRDPNHASSRLWILRELNKISLCI